MEDLRFYSKYLALFVCILGTIKYKDIKNTKAKYFLFSIWFLVIIEIVGENFYAWFGTKHSRSPVYNFYTIVQFTFYLWWYRSLMQSLKRKRIITWFIMLNIVFTIINAIYVQDPFRELTSFSYALGVIFLVTTICYYFIEVFQSEKILKIRSSMYFWVSLGLLLFHAAFMPFFFAHSYFIDGNLKLLSLVNFFLCSIMYICFAIGFFKVKESANEYKLG